MSDLWALIESQRGLADRIDCCEIRFRDLPVFDEPKTQEKVRNEYLIILKALDTLEIWEACSLVCGVPCGDSSFLHFRNWLIWQGKGICDLVLKDADHLADLHDSKQVDLANPFVEVLGWLSFEGPWDASDVSQFGFDAEWTSQDSSENTIARHLPKLWKLFSNSFRWELPISPATESVLVAGLGVLKKGETVVHLAGYGVGKIVDFPVLGTAIAVIDFADSQRTMNIDARWFSKG